MFPVSGGVHLDEFTLLRRHTRDLDENERVDADRHLEDCSHCTGVLREIELIDMGLRAFLEVPPAGEAFAADDPFAARPEQWAPRSHAASSEADEPSTRALAASERAVLECERLRQAAEREEGVRAAVESLPLSDPANRFALIYWMQTVRLEAAQGPLRALELADAVRERVSGSGAATFAGSDAERLLPLGTVVAHAYLLAGRARIWTGEQHAAGEDLAAAYRLFAQSTGDAASFAIVELNESQRRSFIGRPLEGLHLARRAEETFEALGLEDFAVRAQIAQGNAMFFLDRPEGALAIYRGVIPLLEARELWRNYVGVVNSAGECLLKLGRPDEARREYARALRRLLREPEPILVAFVRHGLANSLFFSGRYREAALSFARVARFNQEVGLTGNALIAGLFEIESWARYGDSTRAAERLDRFQADIARHGSMDPSILAELERALSGAHPDLERVGRLREMAESALRELFPEVTAKKTS